MLKNIMDILLQCGAEWLLTNQPINETEHPGASTIGDPTTTRMPHRTALGRDHTKPGVGSELRTALGRDLTPLGEGKDRTALERDLTTHEEEMDRTALGRDQSTDQPGVMSAIEDVQDQLKGHEVRE